MEYKEMCRYITPYVCPVCGNELLFFTTSNNKLIDYKGLMSDHCNLSQLKSRLYYKNIRHIKCITCNKVYVIDWSNGYPTPLYDKSILNNFR
jgi:hypothetical protein